MVMNALQTVLVLLNWPLMSGIVQSAVHLPPTNEHSFSTPNKKYMGNGYNSPIDMRVTHSATTLVPGYRDSFTFRCVVYPHTENMLVQIIKSKMEFKGTGTYYSRPDGPFIISNGDRLNSAILAYTDRYSAKRKQNGANITIHVKDVQVEDSGSWACRVLQNGGVLIKSKDVELTVTGPMLGIDLYFETFSGEHRKLVHEPGRLESASINEKDQGMIVCVINFTNVEPLFRVVMRSGQHVTTLTDDFYVIIGGVLKHPVHVMYGSNLTLTAISRPNLLLTYKDNGGLLTCEASLDFYEPLGISAILNITFAPKQVHCQQDTIRVPLGERGVSLICSAIGNPRPRVDWVIPGGLAVSDEHPAHGVSVLVLRNITSVTSILTIKQAKSGHFGSYRMRVGNEYGVAFTYVQVMRVDDLQTHEKQRDNAVVVKSQRPRTPLMTSDALASSSGEVLRATVRVHTTCLILLATWLTKQINDSS